MTDRKPLGFDELIWPDPPDGSWTVRVWWAEVEGRPEPVGFSAWRGCQLVDGVPVPLPGDAPRRIRAPDLRLPFAKIVAELRRKRFAHSQAVAEATAGYREMFRPARGQPTPKMAQAAQNFEAFLAGVEAEPERWEGRHRGRLTSEYLAQVADIYRKALPAGNATKAVAQELGLPYSTAAKHIARAAEAGLLPKTTQGRARGAQSP